MLSPIKESTHRGNDGAELVESLTLAQVPAAEEEQAEAKNKTSNENIVGSNANSESSRIDSPSLPSISNPQGNQDLASATNENQVSYEGAAKTDSESFKFELGEGKSNPNRGSAFDIKSKIPGLVALTLPLTPQLLTNESFSLDAEPLSDSDSSGPGSPLTPPLLKKIPLSTFGPRPRTRLFDPPPLTPAVKSQLTHCNSSLRRRGASLNLFVSEEQQNAKIEGAKAGRVSSQVSAATPHQLLNSNLEHIPSNSKLVNDTSASVEEEQDPLDDDSIPSYKKRRGNEFDWFCIFQWLILLLLVVFLACSVNIKSLEAVRFLGLNLWRWQALTLVFFCGHLISGWFVKMLVVLIEKHYLLKKRVLYFVYGLRHSVKNCIWLAFVLGVWEVIFSGHGDITVGVLSKILWCLFTASMSWMVKVLAVKVAANSFHRTAYFDRIQECLFNQYLLETLSGPPAMVGILDSEVDEPGHTRQSISIEEGQVVTPLNASDSSQEPVKVGCSSTQACPKVPEYWSRSNRKNSQGAIYVCPLQNLDSTFYRGEGSIRLDARQKRGAVGSPHHTTVEVGGVASSDGHTPNRWKNNVTYHVPLIARSPIPIEQRKLQELTSDTVSAWTLKRLMKRIRNTNMTTYSSMLSHEKGDSEISSEVQAKAAAKLIFYNIARPGQKYLMLKDFLSFLPEEQAAIAFSLFETTESGKITKKSFMKWVVGAYKERRALALTLNDNKTVVAKLHRVLNCVLSVTLIIIFFLIFGVSTSKLLVFFSSIFIPSVFVFGNAARSTFESLLFLFVTHPYDVGDRIVVDGQVMLVEEMNVLNTIVLNSSNEKVYFPNALLATKPISNLYRSPDQGDAIEFQISMSTPIEKLGAVKERMQRFIESLPQFWYPDFRIVCKDIDDCNKMKMAIWVRHHMNFQEGGERYQRRSNMLLYLKQQLEDLGIAYELPRQEIMVTGIPVISDLCHNNSHECTNYHCAPLRK